MDLKSLLGMETVDSILASFETQREKLRGLSIKLQDAARRESEEAAALQLASEAKRGEAERALRVAQKISDLVA